MNVPAKMIWRSIEPGTVDYPEALNLQHRVVRAKIDDRSFDDLVIMLEHPSVFTLGRRGGIENLMVSANFLEARSITLVHTERGGDITYHGPGQLVVYPLIDLAAHHIGVLTYVEKLETVMIKALEYWGIAGHRRPAYRGVWVDQHKIGSIGVAIRKNICFHGFALNVNLSLEPFQWIHPCGLDGVTMTSMQQALLKPISMAEAVVTVKRCVAEVFGIQFTPLALESLLSVLNRERQVA